MNRTRLIFLFFFINLNVFYAQSQSILSGKIIYKASLDINIENIVKGVSEQVKIKMMAVARESKDLDYSLFFKDTESLFYLNRKMKNDNDDAINMTKTLAGSGVFYSDTKGKNILHQKESFGEDFIISAAFKDWELSQESKLIGKYKCYKATTIKKTESRRGINIKKVSAWYTPEIPVNFGPKEYSGLPGLILELQEGKLSFTATKIELNPKREIKIKKPIKGKKVTLEEYNKIIKDLVTNYRRQ